MSDVPFKNLKHTKMSKIWIAKLLLKKDMDGPSASSPRLTFPPKILRCQTFSSKNVKTVNSEIIDTFEIQKYQGWPCCLLPDQHSLQKSSDVRHLWIVSESHFPWKMSKLQLVKLIEPMISVVISVGNQKVQFQVILTTFWFSKSP